MRNKYIIAIVKVCLLTAFVLPFDAFPIQNPLPVSTALEKNITEVINNSMPENYNGGKVKVNKVVANQQKRLLTVKTNESMAYRPLSSADIASLKKKIVENLPAQYSGYSVEINVENTPIEKYSSDYKYKIVSPKEHVPFVFSLDEQKAGKGLAGKNIALWQSHGWYFEQKLNRWEWQRARLLTTVEDLYTQSYVVPFLIPMLENAGAYVMTPRERDYNTNEIIVDADGGYAQTGYKESNGSHSWEDAKIAGFAYKRKVLLNGDNPFRDGKVRQVQTSDKEQNASAASWTADFPQKGRYAVYVSYASMKNSAPDALYIVNSLEGTKKFTVNQQMGGGTWVYLGSFLFDKGKDDVPTVELIAKSSNKDAVVTADAVKIGGGMGNVARKVETSPDGIEYDYVGSGYPRFVEGARYWLQWAGAPDSVYSPSKNQNDYTDDYKCRGIWVNYLAGGSSVLPENKGLKIPIDMSMAFHTDAGTTPDTTIVGTLGIYCSNGNGKYVNGTDRMASRKLMDDIMTNIVKDVRAKYEPQWTRRGMWDKSYFEARVPEVPAILLELLSHQNFADMTYGLNPAFRFTVSRAIYKGILKFLSERDGVEYVVQPLPVSSFAIDRVGNDTFRLSWTPTVDELEKTATPEKYIVEQRINDGGFKRMQITDNTSIDVVVKDENIHSYRIIAVNDGGKSFPSEALALCSKKDEKGLVQIINGFTRVSAPDAFQTGDFAGFYDTRDHGVPYVNDILYSGAQYEYRRNLPWTDDDAPGFGASHSDYETLVIAGNTFDYPFVHGKSVAEAGYSFISTSIDAFVSNEFKEKPFAIDLILGKQKEINEGRGVFGSKFHIYPKTLQKKLTDLANRKVNMVVTGSYVGTDLWDNPKATGEDKTFAKTILGYSFLSGQAAIKGDVSVCQTKFSQFVPMKLKYSSTLNSEIYAVESPDCLTPANDKQGVAIMRYSENNAPASVAVDMNGYRTVIVGFPFETIISEDNRNELMKQILSFFETDKSK